MPGKGQEMVQDGQEMSVNGQGMSGNLSVDGPKMLQGTNMAETHPKFPHYNSSSKLVEDLQLEDSGKLQLTRMTKSQMCVLYYTL